MTITELGLWVTSHTGCHGYDKEFGFKCHSWGFHDYYRVWFVTESHTVCHGYDKEFGLRCHSWGFHAYYRAWFVGDVTHWLPRLRQRVWFEMPQLGFP